MVTATVEYINEKNGWQAEKQLLESIYKNVDLNNRYDIYYLNKIGNIPEKYKNTNFIEYNSLSEKPAEYNLTRDILNFVMDRYREYKQETSVSSLSSDVLMAYTDATVSGNYGGVGIVLLDVEGNMKLISQDITLERNNSVLAEIMGIRIALENIVNNTSCSELEMYFDFEGLEDLLKEENYMDLFPEEYNKIEKLKSNIEHLRFRSIPREDNSLADCLANLAREERLNINT